MEEVTSGGRRPGNLVRVHPATDHLAKMREHRVTVVAKILELIFRTKAAMDWLEVDEGFVAVAKAQNK